MFCFLKDSLRILYLCKTITSQKNNTSKTSSVREKKHEQTQQKPTNQTKETDKRRQHQSEIQDSECLRNIQGPISFHYQIELFSASCYMLEKKRQLQCWKHNFLHSEYFMLIKQATDCWPSPSHYSSGTNFGSFVVLGLAYKARKFENYLYCYL